MKADATHWLTDPEYATLRHRLEAAHAATEAALVEAAQAGEAEREARRINAPSRWGVRCSIHPCREESSESEWRL